jgi:hypothetical protein
MKWMTERKIEGEANVLRKRRKNKEEKRNYDRMGK